MGRQAILQRSATFTVTGKKRFFCAPNTDHEVCVSLWEPSADTAAPDWLLHPSLGCWFSQPGTERTVQQGIVSDLRPLRGTTSGWVGSPLLVPGMDEVTSAGP